MTWLLLAGLALCLIGAGGIIGLIAGIAISALCKGLGERE